MRYIPGTAIPVQRVSRKKNPSRRGRSSFPKSLSKGAGYFEPYSFLFKGYRVDIYPKEGLVGPAHMGNVGYNAGVRVGGVELYAYPTRKKSEDMAKYKIDEVIANKGKIKVDFGSKEVLLPRESANSSPTFVMPTGASKYDVILALHNMLQAGIRAGYPQSYLNEIRTASRDVNMGEIDPQTGKPFKKKAPAKKSAAPKKKAPAKKSAAPKKKSASRGKRNPRLNDTYWTLLEKHNTLIGNKSPTVSQLGKFKKRPIPRNGELILINGNTYKITNATPPKEVNAQWYPDAMWAKSTHQRNYAYDWKPFMPEDLIVLSYDGVMAENPKRSNPTKKSRAIEELMQEGLSKEAAEFAFNKINTMVSGDSVDYGFWLGEMLDAQGWNEQDLEDAVDVPIEFPPILAKLVKAGKLVDSSYGNDVTSSFMLPVHWDNDYWEAPPRLWVFHQRASQREYEDSARYEVTDGSDSPELVYAGSDIKKALAALNKLKNRKGRPL